MTSQGGARAALRKIIFHLLFLNVICGARIQRFVGSGQKELDWCQDIRATWPLKNQHNGHKHLSTAKRNNLDSKIRTTTVASHPYAFLCQLETAKGTSHPQKPADRCFGDPSIILDCQNLCGQTCNIFICHGPGCFHKPNKSDCFRSQKQPWQTFEAKQVGALRRVYAAFWALLVCL